MHNLGLGRAFGGGRHHDDSVETGIAGGPAGVRHVKRSGGGRGLWGIEWVDEVRPSFFQAGLPRSELQLMRLCSYGRMERVLPM